MPVMPSRCKSCPFGPRGDIRTRERVISTLMDGSQHCHSTGHPLTTGTEATHLCRGARDWQLQALYRLRILSEPTDAAWSALWQSIQTKKTK